MKQKFSVYAFKTVMKSIFSIVLVAFICAFAVNTLSFTVNPHNIDSELSILLEAETSDCSEETEDMVNHNFQDAKNEFNRFPITRNLYSKINFLLESDHSLSLRRPPIL